jgi:hypothetical protein
MENIRPVLDPILNLFKSRKFLLALFAVVQSIVFHFCNVAPELWQAIDALVAVLIAMIAAEDAAQKLNS